MDLAIVATICGVIALGAISPGPSFIMVAQTALSSTPARGRTAALGVGAASLIFSVAATLGLGAVMLYAEWLFIVLKIAGGGYLVYLGIRMWLAAGTERPHGHVTPQGGRRTFATALLTQLSNPKAIIVYSSVFASVLPREPSLTLLIAVPLATTLVETAWYLIVATLLSRTRPQHVYERWTKAIDRIAGAALGGLGTYFAIDGIRTVAR